MNTRGGYTLFELVVSIGVITLILGMSISGYSSYNKKERVKQAALNLKSDLRQAQSNAISAEKPTTNATCAPLAAPCCTTFSGIRVTYGSGAYSFQHECNNGIAGLVTVGPVESHALPSNVNFSLANSFTFLALTKAVNINIPLTIGITNGTDTYSLQIYPSGDIMSIGF